MLKTIENSKPKASIFKNGLFWDKDLFNKAINHNREICITWIGVIVTTIALIAVGLHVGSLTIVAYQEGKISLITQNALFMALILFLIYGNFLYQFTRIGYMKRLKEHTEPSNADANKQYQKKDQKILTFLLPSYREEMRVIEQSMLSTALQEYPNKRVVLLVDDPPHPKKREDWLALENARILPKKIQNILAEPRVGVKEAYDAFLDRKKTQSFNSFMEALELCKVIEDVAQWFLEKRNEYDLQDHTDQLFVKITFEDNYIDLENKIVKLEHDALNGQLGNAFEEMDLVYRRLLSRFEVDVTTFERKLYENLSHEPNKAMNLNSYISLLDKNFVEEVKGNKLFLRETANADEASLKIPGSDYLVTLDADSMLSSDYALRLVHLMEKEGNDNIAVAQTPYSAVPQASSMTERIAGATTDMQFLIHQGFTYFNSTFWVGANALLRVRALSDIVETVKERGYTFNIYIQDRTVIEDTESSVDLTVKGWMLFNYPRRLSYSATPPDFGSLYIQRARWANGGLIILPKLMRRLIKGPFSWKLVQEAFFRTHYLVSIAAVNISLPLLLLFPFDQNLNSAWLPLTALPYYFFYGRDLILAGYNIVDLFRVYAMNLMLIPVNLAGVFKSIQQGILKNKIPFKRTPKVSGRTTAPLLDLMFQYIICIGIFLGVGISVYYEKWPLAIFGAVNGMFYIYAITKFIGVKESYSDIFDIRRKEPPQLSNQFECPCQICQVK